MIGFQIFDKTYAMYSITFHSYLMHYIKTIIAQYLLFKTILTITLSVLVYFLKHLFSYSTYTIIIKLIGPLLC